MAIDPTTTTTVKVSELASAGYNTTDLIPHEVAGILKKGNLQDLATFIGGIISTDASVGFRAVHITDGQTLPATTEEEFILVGPGTYPNVGGGSAVTTTEPLNALVSNGTYWFIGVEIPIGATGVWGTISGTLDDQTDLQDALDLKADLVDGKVPASQLPSYVDDVVEVANYAALPATGETGKIYITIDTNKVYRWSGSAYIEIAADKATWGLIEGTLSNQTDLQNALNAKFNNPTGNTTQYIAGDGSLITFPTAGQAGTLVREVRNTTGSTLTKGTIVYISGATGNKPTVSKAIATGDSTSAQTFGMVQADISNNANGYVVCIGDITGLNTSAITEGSQLYLSSTTAGTYTTTKQLAPAHLVYIGVVTRSHATLGQIEVKIQNGYELDELHDVAISSKTNKDFLVYESSTDLWKNKSLGTIVGGTSSQFIKGDGSLDSTVYALDNTVVKITTNQNVRGIKTFLGDQTATTLKLIVADYYNDGFITSDNGMLRLLNGTTELFNLASTGDLTAKSFVKTGGTASQFLKANGTVDSTTYLSGTVAIANGGTGATTASAARTNLGATTIGSGLFTLPNAGLISFLRVNADNSVELLGADLFRTSIGAGTGNGSVTSVSGTGSYGGLTLTGTVTGSGDLTLGGTPTGTWPISITGNASSVNTVQVSTNADFYLTFADANNGSPTSEFLYTIGSVKVNPSTGALTAGSFVKSGGTSSQYLMADGSVSTGSGGTVTGTGTTNYIPKFTGASAIGNSLIYDNGTNVGIGTASPSYILQTKAVSGFVGAAFSSSYAATSIIGNDANSSWFGQGTNGLGSAYVINNTSGYAQIELGGSPRFYVNSSGNVGIGTTSPSTTLDVNGTGRINGDVNLATSSGNVGIGAGPASQKLDVNGNIRINNGSPTANTLIGILGFGPSGYGGINTSEISANFEGANWYNGSNLIFKTSQSGDITASSSVERMRITSGGNVEIKNSDSRLLGGNTSGRFIVSNSDTSAYVSINGSANGTPNNIALITNSQITFNTGASYSESMRITSGGNVGIGTSSPSEKLEVQNGTSGAKIKVSNTGGGYAMLECSSNATSTATLSFTNSISITGGNATFSNNVTATGFFNSSDNRLKDLTDYDYNVSDIKPITYLWKDGRDNKKHVGYSAQEVQKVMPDAVNEDEKGFLSVNYIEVLVAKIAELENRIKQLEK